MEKEKHVKRYLNGESAVKLPNEIDTTDKIIREWTNKYNNYGIDGLKSKTGKLSSKHKNMGLNSRKPKNKLVIGKGKYSKYRYFNR